MDGSGYRPEIQNPGSRRGGSEAADLFEHRSGVDK